MRGGGARVTVLICVELQLSGHTHGGQVAMLWLHRSLSLARIITPFVAGLYRAGSSYLYVNRGAGSVMPMVRLGARPEVTELTLVSPDDLPDDIAIPAQLPVQDACDLKRYRVRANAHSFVRADRGGAEGRRDARRDGAARPR